MSETIEGQRVKVSVARIKAGRLSLGLAAMLALSSGGCDRHDEVAQTIAKTRNTLEALAAGGAAPQTLRHAKYQEIVSALTPIAQQSNGESVSLAQALLGEALAGQGEIAADAFRSADQELLRAVSAASAALNLYVEQRALEASLTGYSPEADIATFSRTSDERRKERTSAVNALAETVSQRDQLLERASSIAGQGQALRENEAKLRTQASAAPAAERLPLVESAQRLRRQWEALLKQAEELRAEAAQFDPLIVETELTIKQSDRQLASLDQARESARARAESLRTESVAAGRAADQAAEVVTIAFDAVLAAINEGSIPAFEEAQSKYDQALTRVGSARGVASRPGATVSAATIAHALGSLRREQGESLARVAFLLEQAGKARPALAGAGEYAATAQRLRTQAIEVLQAAADAYERASASFESSDGGGSQDVSERMSRLARELSELRRSITGEPEPEPALEEDEYPSNPDEISGDQYEGQDQEGIAVPDSMTDEPQDDVQDEPTDDDPVDPE